MQSPSWTTPGKQFRHGRGRNRLKPQLQRCRECLRIAAARQVSHTFVRGVETLVGSSHEKGVMQSPSWTTPGKQFHHGRGRNRLKP
jgi:hypothetical protein